MYSFSRWRRELRRSGLLPRLAVLFILICAPIEEIAARPEYAVKNGVNRCTACHLSPVGGAERNIYGKYYGARDFKPGPFSHQDLISVDARALFYRPEPGVPSQRGGLGWMAGIIGANIPLSQPDESIESRLVLSHGITGFASGQNRNLYLRERFYEDTENSWLPQYVLIGRFHTPFGLLSDEHRSYVRMQTKTTWNDFEMGALISGDLGHSVHYDWAIVNGEKTAGTAPAEDLGVLWGHILNLRFQTPRIPVLIGVSGSSHKRDADRNSPYAGTVYGVISLDRIFGHSFFGSLSGEYSVAKYWNAQIDSRFLQDTTYASTIADSQSEAMMVQWTFELSRHWEFLYRYDRLVLDREFPADAFDRHGIGFRHWIGPNIILNGRIEDSTARAPSEEDGTGKGAVDGFWFVLQVGV